MKTIINWTVFSGTIVCQHDEKKHFCLYVTFQRILMSHVMYRAAPVINTWKQLSTPHLPLNDDNNDVEIKLFPNFLYDYLINIIIERFTSK